MDSYRDHPTEFEPAAAEPAPEETPALAIGSDERRMHVRAYNYWCSLLDGRDYPSIEDLEPGDIQDFGPHSVLLDFTEGLDNPATPYIGAAIRDECGLGENAIKTIDGVPSRSLLSRLTDHYMQIIANRAPVGFEAEFVNQRGHAISYRGIMMPFSSDGDTIDFIYGVINWKDSGQSEAIPQVVRAELPPLSPEVDDEDEGQEEAECEGPQAAFEPSQSESAIVDEAERDEFSIPYPDTGDATEAEPVPEVDAEAGLADRLCAARDCAEVCKAADGRSRAALYRALGMAYDFAVAARRVPEDYAEILDDAGVKTQARAPMTPVVKLIFGIDYDKTRLTEFSAALSFAERSAVDFGGFEQFLDKAEGGLKGLVAAERRARRPQPNIEDSATKGRAALRASPAIALADLPTNEEFALVLTRRNAAGVHEAVRLVSDAATLERLIRRCA